jgi:hypothetical protein
VGVYSGAATLRDQNQEPIDGDVTVSLATTDLMDGGWRGYAYGIDLTARDGEEIFVELPHGTSGKARVVIDLTGDQPLTRLVGIEGDPV